MSEIETAADLDALPVDTLVVDAEGDEWRKLPNLNWALSPSHAADFGVESKWLMETFCPLSRIGDASGSELRVTRCCGSDSCTVTTPLPPGSSWLCSAHSNLLPGGGNAS